MRELARRVGISEAELAYGREPIDPEVSRAVRAVETAEKDGKGSEVVRAYQALSRAASRAARERAA